eukprot:CAMPEP_0185692652 /NCGR_PEP_ID=MMETSP1164-20130828/2681_1 /TAXON_ID=1104430 /ORGANISM="Chrysoreinhardia sp, Strain CCMP2950" /LENGTH=94 /DNA_ID=CAMNT_0028359393 /DNA_START=34 /DNA_END=318 /DNA_ORIENTATION=-
MTLSVRLLSLLALVAAAAAFVAPHARLAATSAARPATVATHVAPVDAVVDAAPALQSFLVASSESDFGGYFFPVVGLTLLGAIITFLSPPLKDE